MTSYVTPKKNSAFIIYASLPSVANSSNFQSNPTIAAGDFKVSIDGGTLNNMTNLPTVTPASSKMVQFSLTSTEMNGDNITIVGSDAAGNEWKDVIINIQTTARQIDDLAYPATSGRSIVVDANGLVDATTVKLGPSGSGTAQTAKDVGAAVPSASPGASGGLLIAGSNAATTIAGLTLAGAAASGATPATEGLTVTGGAASITGGGTAGRAASFTGGAGAASTNGAAVGVRIAGGGTNTVASTATGLQVAGTSTGHGISAISGTGSTGDGFNTSSNATNGAGINAAGIGTGQGILATAGATGNGFKTVGGSTSGDGMVAIGGSGGANGATFQATGNVFAGIYCYGGTGSRSHGLLAQGSNAVTTSFAGDGIKALGGTASTGAGGTAGYGIEVVGGAGAASTNGAQSGMSSVGGGTNTVASSAHGIVVTGSSTGSGISAGSGSGATGDGIAATANSTNGNGVTFTHSGTGKDMNATTTPLALAKTTNITGFNDITAAAAATGVWQDTTAGDFTVASSIGKSLYTSGVAPGASGGLFIAGSNAATTANITGNITGNLSGSVGSVTGSVGSVTGAVGSVTGNVGGNVVGSVASVTGNVGGNVTGSVGSVVSAVAITSNTKKNQALNGFTFAMTDSTTHGAKTGLTVTAERSKDGGAFAACSNSVTEVGNGLYTIDLSATDLNANTVALKFTATGADQRMFTIVTQP